LASLPLSISPAICCFGSSVDLVLNLVIKDLRDRRHHRRTTSTPLRSATRGVRSQGAATAPPGFTSNAPFATEVQSNIEQSCCSTVTAYDSECRQNEPIYGETRNKVAQSREITLGGDCQLRPVVQTLLVLLLQAHFDFDAKVTDCTFDLCMTEQKLDGSKVTGPAIDQRRFCTSTNRYQRRGAEARERRGRQLEHLLEQLGHLKKKASAAHDDIAAG